MEGKWLAESNRHLRLDVPPQKRLDDGAEGIALQITPTTSRSFLRMHDRRSCRRQRTAHNSYAYCGSTGPGSQDIRHQRIRFTCPKCKKDFTKWKQLSRHYNEVCEQIKKYVCPEPNCPKEFNLAYRLRSHRQRTHYSLEGDRDGSLDDLKTVHNLDPKYAFGCGFCEKLFTGERRQKLFLKHLVWHYYQGKTIDEWTLTQQIESLLTRADLQGLWYRIRMRRLGTLPDNSNPPNFESLDVENDIYVLEHSVDPVELQNVLSELAVKGFRPGVTTILQPFGFSETMFFQEQPHEAQNGNFLHESLVKIPEIQKNIDGKIQLHHCPESNSSLNGNVASPVFTGFSYENRSLEDIYEDDIKETSPTFGDEIFSPAWICQFAKETGTDFVGE